MRTVEQIQAYIANARVSLADYWVVYNQMEADGEPNTRFLERKNGIIKLYINTIQSFIDNKPEDVEQINKLFNALLRYLPSNFFGLSYTFYNPLASGIVGDVVIGAVLKATQSVYGIVRLSYPSVDINDPIVVSNSDPRITQWDAAYTLSNELYDERITAVSVNSAGNIVITKADATEFTSSQSVILNQFSAPQSASMWISGNARVDGNITAAGLANTGQQPLVLVADANGLLKKRTLEEFKVDVGSGVRTVAGTENQVLVNGGTAAQDGDVTLSLPQDISTSSTPTFRGLSVTGTFDRFISTDSTNGGSKGYNFSAGGTTVWNLVSSAAADNFSIDRYIGGSLVSSALSINRSTGNAVFSNTLTASSFIRAGGLSTQFLKADGSVDSNTYLTGNQTITLSGDISGSGTTSIVTTIGAGKVTNNMLAGSIASSKLIGTDIATVGTITSGIWNGTAIANAYIGTGIDATKIADGSVTNAEFQFINTLTSNAQTQLDNKQPLDADLTAIASLTADGLLRKTAGVWGMDSSIYLTGNQTITLSGEASGSGATAIAVTLSNSAVIGKLLTGYVSGAGIVSATDSILTAIQKLDGNISGLVTGVSSVFGRTGAVTAQSGDYTTAQVTESGNLYFTNARARASISETITGIDYDSNTGVFSLTAGYVIPTTTSAANWDVAYANRITSLTTIGNSGAATLISNTLNIPNYTLAGLGGQPLSTNLTSLSGLTYASTSFVKMTSAGTFALDTNTYLTGNQTITLSGEASGSGATSINVTLANSAVISKVLTGLSITGGAITSSDTILSAFGKVQNQINGLMGGVIYKGTYNASTNTPTLSDGTGTQGWYYVVNVAGTQNFGSGSISFNIGDWAIYNGSIWEKVDNTDSVTSVNGQIGAVVLTTSDITEGTNLYYTNARGIGSTLTGYVSGAGTITAADSILSAIQKLNGNVSALVTGVSSVSGTSNRITVSPTSGAVVVDIASTYAGQNTITTVGTIGTGVWQGTAIADAYIASSATWNAKIGGSGTAGKLAKFGSSSTVVDSIVTESGALITVAGQLLASQSGVDVYLNPTYDTGYAGVQVASAHGLQFATSNITRVTITAGGNFGVGVNPTNAKLEVVAITGEVFRADAAGGALRVVANQTGVLLGGDISLTSTPTTSAGSFDLITRNTSTGVLEKVASSYYATAGSISGTIGRLAKFTSSGAVGDSIVSESGGNIQVAGTQTLIRAGRTLTIDPNIGLLDAYTQFTASTDMGFRFFVNGITNTLTLLNSGNILTGSALNTGEHFIIGGSARVNGALTATGTLTVNEDGASTKIITIRSNWAGVDPAINVTTNNSLLLMTNNTERMRITSGGSVGIGTAIPLNRLVASNSTTYNVENSYAIAAAGNDVAYKLVLGYDETLDAGVISSVRTAVGWKDTWINPNGGALRIGGAAIFNQGGIINSGDLQINGNNLKFDEGGVRSWNIVASGGELNFTSGDSLGLFDFGGSARVNGSLVVANTGANYSAINTGAFSNFGLPAVTNVNLAIGVSGAGSLGSIIQSRDNISPWYLSLNPFGGQIITANAVNTGESFIIGGSARVNGTLFTTGAVSSSSTLASTNGSSEVAFLDNGFLGFYNASTTPKYIKLYDDSGNINAIGFSKSGSASTVWFPSGNVGIGTTSPSSYSFNDPAFLVVANTSGNSTLSIVSSTTGIGYLAFADGTTGTDRYSGSIFYSHSTNTMSFKTAGSDRLEISSTGAATFSSSVTANSYINSLGRTTSYGFRLPDWQIYNTSGGALAFNNYTTDFLIIAAGGSATFSQSVTAGGSVGVGGTNTDSLLTINGTAGTSHERFREGSTTVGFVGGANGIITGHNGKLALRAEAGLVLSGQGNAADLIISSVGAATFSSTLTSDLHTIISGAGSPLVLRKSSSFTGSFYMLFQNVGATQIGYLGYGSGGNDKMQLYNGLDEVAIGAGTSNFTLGYNGAASNINTTLSVNGLLHTTAGTVFAMNSGTESAAYQLNATTMGYNSAGAYGWITAGGASARTTLALNAGGGNVLIGTTTDAGYKLYVNGTFRSNALWTESTGISYWGAHPSTYGGLTWDTGYAQVFATTGNQLRLVAGTAYAVIHPDGNVGINTTNPLSTLHVNGTIRTVLTSGVGGQNLLGAINGVSNGYVINVDTSNNITHTWHTGANNPSMHINATGNVGIGTTSPTAKFHLVTSTGAYGAALAKFEDGWSVSSLKFTNPVGTFALQAYAQDNPSFYLPLVLNNQGGNVLIGTATDDGVNKLQVSGSARVNGALTVSTGRTGLFSGDNFSLGLAQTVGQANYFYLGTNSSGDLLMSDTNGVAKLTITQAGAATFSSSVTAGGSVTIGTGGTYAAGSIYSDANWGMIFRAKQAAPANATFLWTDSADNELMRIKDGKLGIDKASPSYKLDVTGDVRASGRVYIGTNGCYIEEVLVGSTYELRVVDSAGNTTVIS